MIKEVCTESRKSREGQLVLKSACALQTNNQKQALAAVKSFLGRCTQWMQPSVPRGWHQPEVNLLRPSSLLFSALVVTESQFNKSTC